MSHPIDPRPAHRLRATLRRGVGAAAMLAAAIGLGAPSQAAPAPVPSSIRIGTLYASTGPFAVPSLAQYAGLRFWADSVNHAGGVYVKAFHRKIPVSIVAYDDLSSTSTATALYNRLITQDKVDLLASDFGSVLTSVAVPLAAEHKMLLLDQSGSSEKFFTGATPYLADVSIPTTAPEGVLLTRFLLEHKLRRVAVMYDANDFDAPLARSIQESLGKAGVQPVYYHAVPTTESNYNVLLHTVAATHPQAVLELGYPPNDISFLRTLAQSGLHFDLTLTVFPGQMLGLIEHNVGARALAYTYTYPTPPLVHYAKVSYGMDTASFAQTFEQATHKAPTYLDCVGYNTGLMVEGMLGTAEHFSQADFHQALAQLSGKTRTLLGAFALSPEGAQTGQYFPIGQIVPDGKDLKDLKVQLVYPPQVATAPAVIPAPAH